MDLSGGTAIVARIRAGRSIVTWLVGDAELAAQFGVIFSRLDCAVLHLFQLVVEATNEESAHRVLGTRRLGAFGPPPYWRVQHEVVAVELCAREEIRDWLTAELDGGGDRLK